MRNLVSHWATIIITIVVVGGFVFVASLYHEGGDFPLNTFIEVTLALSTIIIWAVVASDKKPNTVSVFGNDVMKVSGSGGKVLWIAFGILLLAIAVFFVGYVFGFRF